jgi:hypothetical protein
VSGGARELQWESFEIFYYDLIHMRYVSENLGSIVLKLQEIWGSIFANTDSVYK